MTTVVAFRNCTYGPWCFDFHTKNISFSLELSCKEIDLVICKKIKKTEIITRI